MRLSRNEELDKEYWIVYFWFMHVCLNEINLDVIYLGVPLICVGFSSCLIYMYV